MNVHMHLTSSSSPFTEVCITEVSKPEIIGIPKLDEFVACDQNRMQLSAVYTKARLDLISSYGISRVANTAAAAS